MRDPVQIPLIETESSWAPPSLLPDLTHATEIAVDLETRDPNLLQLGPGWATNDGEVVGVPIATNDWSGYLPFKHEGGGNLDKDFVLAWVKRQMSSPADKIFHNSLYDVGWLKREGIEIQGKIQDTMIAAPLINENRHRYSLDSLGFEYCGDRKDETLLKQAAKDWGINPRCGSCRQNMWALMLNKTRC